MREVQWRPRGHHFVAEELPHQGHVREDHRSHAAHPELKDAAVAPGQRLQRLVWSTDIQKGQVTQYGQPPGPGEAARRECRRTGARTDTESTR